MTLAIHSTTGTRYDLSVPHDETVEGLRKRLSQRLKVPKERLALLHKDTRLSSGKLQEFGVGDGSKLTLVPTVEAGLMSQASRPEQSVMQALESLTETQVSNLHSLPGGGARQAMATPRDHATLWTPLEPPVVCASLVACGGGDESPASVPAWPGHHASSSSLPPPAPDHLTLRSFLSHGDCHGCVWGGGGVQYFDQP